MNLIRLPVTAPRPHCGLWFPLLALTTAGGLLTIALADDAARAGAGWSYPAFWLGLGAIYLPIAYRLLATPLARSESLALACLLGISLYLVKVLYSPTGFVLHDEFAHWRTAADILGSGRLFSPNPLIPVSSLYPGLESVTAEFAAAAGIPIFASGLAVIGAARIIMMLALWLLYERVSGSPRIAGVAVLIYAAVPNFLFWQSQFAYESLALPLALLAVLALTRRRRPGEGRIGAAVIAGLLVGGVVVTHHATAFVLAGMLAAWWVAGVLLRKRGAPGFQTVSALPAVLTAAAAGAWVLLVARPAVHYLSGPLQASVSQLSAIWSGQLAPRQLFANGGHADPIVERWVAVASALLLLVLLPLGIRWAVRMRPRSALALVLVAMAAVYPLTLPARYSANGQELASRMLDFIFIGIALIGAYALTRPAIAGLSLDRLFKPMVITSLAVLFAGGVVLGTGSYARLPGPYLVGAGPRSIDKQGAELANWMLSDLGPGNRLTADRINSLQLGAYGEQHPVSGLTDGVAVWEIYFPDHWVQEITTTLVRGRVRYVVVDRRLATAKPYDGVYFENGEAPNYNYPISRQALLKFDGLYGTSRLYDSGDLIVYDVSGLEIGPPRGSQPSPVPDG